MSLQGGQIIRGDVLGATFGLVRWILFTEYNVYPKMKGVYLRLIRLRVTIARIHYIDKRHPCLNIRP